MGKEIGWKYIVGTMQTSGKMLAILQSREFEFNKKRLMVCRTAFSFEIKRRFLLPKPSRRIDSPVGHVGMENCAKAFSFSSGLYLCRYVCLCPPFSLSHFSFTLCTSFSAPFHLVVLPYFFFPPPAPPPRFRLPILCLLFKSLATRLELSFLPVYD